MARALQTPEWSSRSGPKGEDLTKIEQWFFRQGVPQFVYAYSPGDSLPVLFYLLLIVVAFDLAIQPWASLNPLFLLVTPAALVFGLSLGLFVKARISYLTSKPIGLLKLFASGALVACLIFIFLLGRDVYWSNFSVDFVVIAGLLWSSSRLFRSDMWSGSDAEFRKRRRRLYAVVAIAVICFALEGSILPDSAVLMDGVLGSIMPAAVPVPQALAALLVTVIIAVQSHGLIPKSNKAGEDVAQQPFNVFFPAVPLLILILCAETAILPYVAPTWVAAAVPLVVAAMVGLASPHVPLRKRRDKPTPTGTTRRPPWLTTPKWLKKWLTTPKWLKKWLTTPKWLKELASERSVRRFIHYPGVTSLVVLYLVACPLLVATLAAFDENQPSTGTHRTLSVATLTFQGWRPHVEVLVRDQVVGRGTLREPANARSAFLLTFAINLFYLSLVVGIAVFGIHRVARWAIKEAFTNLLERISNLGRGLSILVVFAALALLTAETWETMLRIRTDDYLLLVGSILGLTGAFHLITAIHHMTKKTEFGYWSDVRDAALSEQELSQNDEQAPSNNDRQQRDLRPVGPVPDLTGAFGLITSAQHSTKKAESGTSSEVRTATPKQESSENNQPAPPQNDDNSPDREIKEFLDCNELSHLKANSKAPKHRLGGLAAINIVIVMMIYEIFFFIPVMMIAAIVFLLFGYVAVPPLVAANWIYGDRASKAQADGLTDLSLIQQPWPRVALLLTAFSILYLAVEILSDPDKRGTFFGSADKAVRRRLAVRLAYCEVLARRDLPDQRHRRPFDVIAKPTIVAHRTADWQPSVMSTRREPETPIGRSSRSAPTTGQTAGSPDQPEIP